MPSFCRAALSWDRAANLTLRKAAASGNVAAFSKAWQARQRSAKESSANGTGCGERVLWSQHAFAEESGLARLLTQAITASTKKPVASTGRPVNKPALTWSRHVKQLVSELTDAVTSAEQRPFASYWPRHRFSREFGASSYGGPVFQFVAAHAFRLADVAHDDS